ncbi:MAG: molybdopterin-binding protein [Spirochaetes bacterium]|nr:molybdopterin-binding protein [Spirochaetota bacterium]
MDTKYNKAIPVREAVGKVLGHDLTQIIPGESKGPAFKRGHKIREEDISRLLDMGKENIYVWDLNEGFVHEDDAAKRIALAVSGKGLSLSPPREGKIELSAEYEGLLKINVNALLEINRFPEVMLATIHTDQRVKKGNQIAGTRIIPLVIQEEYLEKVEEICKKYESIIEVMPFNSLTIGIVTTGSEVYSGRIKDAFGPVIRKKMDILGCSVLDQTYVPDSADSISEAIKSLINRGANAITVTGGMSVDPDDVTPVGIKNTGADIISYGAPVLPGAMFMLAYIGEIPIMGLPGCVMYHRTTIFDLVFARILAGERLTREDIVKYCHGGMCLDCEQCRYPICGFGKG